MKMILVAGSTKEYNRLENIINTWDDTLTLFSSDSYETTLQALEKTIVNLLILPFDANDNLFLKKITKLTHTFPYIPIILIANGKSGRQPGSEPDGVSCILETEHLENLLPEEIKKQLQTETDEAVQDIPLHTFLQMLECEERTCTLEVNSTQKRGFLYIENGTLLDAETEGLQGEKAAEQILSWSQPSFNLRPFNGLRQLQIQKPLIAIIMDTLRQKSKTKTIQKDFSTSGNSQLLMQHQLTRGRKLPIEVGEKIQIQFPESKIQLESHMVGMIPDKLLIVTTLSPLDGLKSLVGSPKGVLIKFLDRGRAWLFKAQLLHCMDYPGTLLILDYPGIIHYHELSREKRTPIFIPMTLHLDNEKEFYGTLIDLSNSGSLCRVKKNSESGLLSRVTINHPIVIRCLLPGINEEQKIQGRIRNIREQELDIKIGIEFENLQSQLSDTIRKYIRSLESAIQ